MISSIIPRKFTDSLRTVSRRSRLVRFLYYTLHLSDIPVFLKIGSFENSMFATIQSFRPEIINDKQTLGSLRKDIRNCFYRYRTTPLEYFLFEFSSKPHSERKQYLSDALIMFYAAGKSGRKIHDAELNNKYRFYLINKRFFKRNVFYFTAETNTDEFIDFALTCGRIIAKPNEAALGKGIKMYETSTREDSLRIYNLLAKSSSNYILEEVISQHSEMAKWNSSSVNTIRINSFFNGKEVKVFGPFIRTGRKGSVVDNGGCGGIFASIDLESGIIITDGMDESKHIYITHPDSHVQYRGLQIPQWPELLNMVEAAHRNMPKHKYISWDLALRPDGWCLIEGNWGEMVAQQVTLKRGLKQEFLNLINN